MYGPNTGLAPGRRQDIILTKDDALNGHSEEFSKILILWKKNHLKVFPAKSPFKPGPEMGAESIYYCVCNYTPKMFPFAYLFWEQCIKLVVIMVLMES